MNNVSSIYNNTPPPNSPSLKSPFHPGRFVIGEQAKTIPFASVEDAWSHGLNEHAWRHGLVFNAGNEMNVTPDRCRERLWFIGAQLLRKMFGNQYRKRGGVTFLAAQEGSRKSYNQHFHVLMMIDGNHGWDDERVAQEIKQIDSQFLWRDEKPVKIDYDWQKENRYHSYTTKLLQRPSDTDWFMIQIGSCLKSRIT